MTNPTAWVAALHAIDERVSDHHLAADGRHPLIRDAMTALRAAVDEEPRDMTLFRGRVTDLAADALRVIRSMVQTGEVAGLATPTVDRLPGMIADFAPNTANAHILSDDPVSRFADEIILAAEVYVDADPRTVTGSSPGQLEALFRVIGLAAHALAV
jgi:hypothetical protein